jgi:hypothetical protein
MGPNGPKLKALPTTRHLGWSFSRNSVFEKCKRRYYYQYYPGRNLPDSAKTFELRSLTAPPLEIGILTHRTISKILECYQSGDYAVTLERIERFLNQCIDKISAEKKFAAVYYDERKDVDLVSEIKLPVLDAVSAFLGSARFQWIVEEALVARNDWLIELPKKYKYGEFRIAGLKALGRMDALFPIEGEFHIFDWKTGESGGYAEFNIHLKAYAAWARYHFDAAISDTRTYIVLLRPEFTEHLLQLNDYDMDEFATLVRVQHEAMLSYCDEPDQDYPKAKEEFPMSSVTGLVRLCRERIRLFKVAN